MTTVTALDGETVDAICWRELGRTQGVTEQVLSLNPGLAGLGAALPGGTTVILPELTQMTPAVLETINLWD